MRRKANKKRILFTIIGLIVLISAIVILCLILNKDSSNKETIKENNKNDEVIEKIKIIDVDSDTRPYAIMINCHNGALPHAGLQDAYIVYELMVEGGITRMMALFKDKDLNKVGSVRSARTQYLGYVYENDAIYMHAGGADDAINRIYSEGISSIDVDGKYGIRDTSLNRAWEHTLFTSSELIKQGISDRGFRTEANVDNLLNYQAEPLNLEEYTAKSVANNISIKYSYYRTSEYAYNEETKTYLRSMNGSANTDLVTGDQYQVKNIIVYGVNYSNYCDHGYCAYQKIDNIGTGEGYYITEGYAIPITWTKENEKSQTVYTVKETGKELVVNDGNTYIQIYPTSGNLSIN